MSEHVAYFSDWAARTYTCACGWSGPGADLDVEPFEELAQYSCPKCDRHLVLVTYPTGDEIKEAAARGNEEATKMLPQVMARDAREAAAQERWERWKREAVHEAADLPDVEGEELSFVWDLRVIDGAEYFVVTHEGREVCREPAFEDIGRFPAVRSLFKERYGSRFRRLDITDEAKFCLIDPDSISAALKADFKPT